VFILQHVGCIPLILLLLINCCSFIIVCSVHLIQHLLQIFG
jgi:hypothetical protein